MLLDRAERADAGFLQDIISIRAAMRQPTGQGIGIGEVGGNHGRKLSVLLLGAQNYPLSILTQFQVGIFPTPKK